MIWSEPLGPGEDWLSTNEPSRFASSSLRPYAGSRPGENVSVLARELGVSRKSICQWRNRIVWAAATQPPRSSDQSRGLGSRREACSREVACKGGATNLTRGAGPGATANCCA
jgi:hypothetical protein